MKTLQIEVNIAEDRQITIQLPDDIEPGKHQLILVLNPQSAESNPHSINQLAGQIHAFQDVDPVMWQRGVRDEWLPHELST